MWGPMTIRVITTRSLHLHLHLQRFVVTIMGSSHIVSDRIFWSEIPEERRWRSGVKERASTTHSVAVIDSDDRGHSSFGEKYDRSINQSQTHRTYVRSSVGVCIRSLFCYSIWIGFRGQITVGWLRFTVHSLASDSLSSLQFHTKVTSPDLVFMNEL